MKQGINLTMFVTSTIGGQAPSDRVTVKDKRQKISIGLFGFFCALEIAGILMAAAFLVFNLNYSSHR